MPIPPVRGTGTACRERWFGVSSGRTRVLTRTFVTTIETIPARRGTRTEDGEAPVAIESDYIRRNRDCPSLRVIDDYPSWLAERYQDTVSFSPACLVNGGA